MNRIIHGDCTEVLKTLPGESVDFVLTDPPYFVRYKDRSGRSVQNDSSDDTALICPRRWKKHGASSKRVSAIATCS